MLDVFGRSKAYLVPGIMSQSITRRLVAALEIGVAANAREKMKIKICIFANNGGFNA